ncbi:hypothetical protein BHE74_00031771 [Ensete ventricosum]|nr:hypothetical protein BHE74_00031771 [Ensete ventricosum]RZS13657.1 hypothetical protein BHM03_00045272 [Ensete ventricosum]
MALDLDAADNLDLAHHLSLSSTSNVISRTFGPTWYSAGRFVSERRRLGRSRPRYQGTEGGSKGKRVVKGHVVGRAYHSSPTAAHHRQPLLLPFPAATDPAATTPLNFFIFLHRPYPSPLQLLQPRDLALHPHTAASPLLPTASSASACFTSLQRCHSRPSLFRVAILPLLADPALPSLVPALSDAVNPPLASPSPDPLLATPPAAAACSNTRCPTLPSPVLGHSPTPPAATTIDTAPITSVFLPYLLPSLFQHCSFPTAVAFFLSRKDSPVTAASSLAYGLQCCSLLYHSIVAAAPTTTSAVALPYLPRRSQPCPLLRSRCPASPPLAFFHLQPRRQPLPPPLLSLPPRSLFPCFSLPSLPLPATAVVVGCRRRLLQPRNRRPSLFPGATDHGPPATPRHSTDLVAALFLFPCLPFPSYVAVADRHCCPSHPRCRHRSHRCCSFLPLSLPPTPAASSPSLPLPLFPDQQISPLDDLGDAAPSHSTTASSSLLTLTATTAAIFLLCRPHPQLLAVANPPSLPVGSHGLKSSFTSTELQKIQGGSSFKST